MAGYSRDQEKGAGGARLTFDPACLAAGVEALQSRGTGTTGSRMANGSYALHMAHTNHRSRYEDFDLLVAEVVRLGDYLSKRSNR